jgi:hypothetical protein
MILLDGPFCSKEPAERTIEHNGHGRRGGGAAAGVDIGQRERQATGQEGQRVTGKLNSCD